MPPWRKLPSVTRTVPMPPEKLMTLPPKSPTTSTRLMRSKAMMSPLPTWSLLGLALTGPSVTEPVRAPPMRRSE